MVRSGKNNATVSYKKVTTIDSTFTETGIWYKINNGSWTKFTANTAWWPTANEYVNGWGSVDGVTWDQTNDTITYTGVSLVKDTDTTNDYQFGYFDVHVNGSNYGAALNPYTVTNADKGGDGFDIAWAVDSNGAPAGLSHITKVRVYTAAALTSNGTAFTTPSIFGETSAEFCGIFASTSASSSVGVTSAPTSISVGERSLGTPTEVIGNVAVYDLGGLMEDDEVNVTVGSGCNLLINSSNSSTYTVQKDDQIVRVLVQSGEKEPYIVIIK